MLGAHCVISIKGDVKRAYDCDRESYEMANRLITSVELQELKKALAESPHRPGHAQGENLKDVHPLGGHTQQNNLVVHICNSLDPKSDLTLIKFL
jgi:hypothetical protein